MSASEPIAASNSVTYQGTAAPASSSDEHGLSFGEVLSDINPLQYLPVVGTIYRAITGDTIPKPLREAGSLVVSGLVGGPIGVATNLAMLAFEKLTGIDFEDTEQKMLSSLSPATQSIPATPDPAPAVADAGAAPTAATNGPAASTPQPWTAAQLSAYGITRQADGELQQGSLTGADVLNALQLASGGASAVAA